jgi:hypothetical protein
MAVRRRSHRSLACRLVAVCRAFDVPVVTVGPHPRAALQTDRRRGSRCGPGIERCADSACTRWDAPGRLSSLRLCEHTAARIRDPHPRNLVLAPTGDDVLGGRRREPAAHKLDDLRSREAACAQHRFGAAFVAAAVEQFERPDAVGLEVTPARGLARARHRIRITRKPCAAPLSSPSRSPGCSTRGVGRSFGAATRQMPLKPRLSYRTERKGSEYR